MCRPLQSVVRSLLIYSLPLARRARARIPSAANAEFLARTERMSCCCCCSPFSSSSSIAVVFFFLLLSPLPLYHYFSTSIYTPACLPPCLRALSAKYFIIRYMRRESAARSSGNGRIHKVIMFTGESNAMFYVTKFHYF